MKLRLGTLLVALLLAPPMGDAAQLDTSVRADARYLSNVFNSSEDEESDVQLSGGVRLALSSERQSSFTWFLQYAPRYELLLDNDELNQLRHEVEGSFDFAWTHNTSLSGDFRFVQTSRSSRSEAPVGDNDPGDVEVSRGDEDFDVGNASLQLLHQFTPRLSGTISASHSLTRFEADDRADFQATGGRVDLSYALTRRQFLGAGAAVTLQTLGAANNQDERETRFSQLFGTWRMILSPLWDVSLRAGPTFIRSEDQASPSLGTTVLFPDRAGSFIDVQTCPTLDDGAFFLSDQCSALVPDPLVFPLPPALQRAVGQTRSLFISNPDAFERDNDSLTIFANLVLTRRGHSTTWNLTIRRSEGSNFGGQSTTVLNSVASTLAWTPSERWRLVASATFTQQQSATDTSQFSVVLIPLGANSAGIPEQAATRTGELRATKVSRAIDVENFVLSVFATRNFSKRLLGRASLSFRMQKNKGDFLGVGGDFDNFGGFIGLEYRFDPIHL